MAFIVSYNGELQGAADVININVSPSGTYTQTWSDDVSTSSISTQTDTVTQPPTDPPPTVSCLNSDEDLAKRNMEDPLSDGGVWKISYLSGATDPTTDGTRIVFTAAGDGVQETLAIRDVLMCSSNMTTTATLIQTFEQDGDSTGKLLLGVRVDHPTSPTRGYFCGVERRGASNHIVWYKLSAGAMVKLAEYSSDTVVTDYDELRVTAYLDRITVAYDYNLGGQVTNSNYIQDDSYSIGRYGGLYWHYENANTLIIRLDDYACETVVANPTAVVHYFGDAFDFDNGVDMGPLYESQAGFYVDASIAKADGTGAVNWSQFITNPLSFSADGRTTVDGVDFSNLIGVEHCDMRVYIRRNAADTEYYYVKTDTDSDTYLYVYFGGGHFLLNSDLTGGGNGQAWIDASGTTIEGNAGGGVGPRVSAIDGTITSAGRCGVSSRDAGNAGYRSVTVLTYDDDD